MSLDKLMLIGLAGIGSLVVLYAKLFDTALYALVVGVPIAILYKLVT